MQDQINSSPLINNLGLVSRKIKSASSCCYRWFCYCRFCCCLNCLNRSYCCCCHVFLLLSYFIYFVVFVAVVFDLMLSLLLLVIFWLLLVILLFDSDVAFVTVDIFVPIYFFHIIGVFVIVFIPVVYVDNTVVLL